MARQPRQSIASSLAVGGLLLLLGAVLAIAAFLSGKSQPYRTTPPLDIPAYLENANSLRGNTYQLRAEVLHSLAFSPKSGRLISVTSEEQQVLPLLIPPKFQEINVERGQRFFFRVEVDEKGLLRVVAMTKA